MIKIWTSEKNKGGLKIEKDIEPIGKGYYTIDLRYLCLIKGSSVHGVPLKWLKIDFYEF